MYGGLFLQTAFFYGELCQSPEFIWCAIAPNNTTCSVILRSTNLRSHFFRDMLINFPSRRERKAMPATYGCFSRSHITPFAKRRSCTLIN